MGFVERYGLVVLFVLCALIVGVGIFADDGALSHAKETDQRARHVTQRQNSLVMNEEDASARGAGGNTAGPPSDA